MTRESSPKRLAVTIVGGLLMATIGWAASELYQRATFQQDFRLIGQGATFEASDIDGSTVKIDLDQLKKGKVVVSANNFSNTYVPNGKDDCLEFPEHGPKYRLTLIALGDNFIDMRLEKFFISKKQCDFD